MAVVKHITRETTDWATALANMDDGQSGLLTDQDNQHIHRIGSNYYFPSINKHWTGAAWVYHDVIYKDIEAQGKIFAAEYIEHAGDADTLWRFQEDYMYAQAGGVRFLDMRETTQNIFAINYIGDNDIDFIYHSHSGGVGQYAVFFEGSSGNIKFGGNDPEEAAFYGFFRVIVLPVRFAEGLHRRRPSSGEMTQYGSENIL